MKKIVLCISLLMSIGTYSQQLSQVTFNDGANFSYFTFITDYNVLLRITEEGKLTEYGTEYKSGLGNYYAKRLQPYIGRIEYYGADSDSAYKGKIKSIGTCVFTYYNRYDKPTKIGKLRTIGTLILDYYDDFDLEYLRGKLKFIGGLLLEHYPSTDDEAYRGKLRAIGNTPISYYSSFEDKNIRGKIKSISSVHYTWYSSFEMTNGLKTGLYRQNIGGVIYNLQ